MANIDELVKKYSNMEASELRLRIMSLETENNILRAQLDSVRTERNKLLNKSAQIDLSRTDVSDSRPVQSQGNTSSLPPVPRLPLRPQQ